jgi:glycosyltransferase involved in cell wall biosynthesis
VGRGDALTAAPSRRPRILIAITLAEVGGAQTCVAQLLPELADAFEVTVAAHGPGPLRGAAAEAGVSWVELRNVRRRIGPRDVLGLLELIRLIRRLRPDIVHAHSSKAGVLARVAAALCRVRAVVFTAHGWAFKAESGLKSRVYLKADRAVARVTSTIVCVSETERREGLAARTCDERRTVVIRNGVDTALFAPRVHRETSRPRIVSVGRLKAPKDFPTLLEALALLENLRFEAIIAGVGPERSALEAAIGRLGLIGAVDLVGERDDIPELLAEADCFVLSSTSEGLPISVLEAMAAGVPVVASDVGGVHELVTDGSTGYLVPPRDPAALAQALRQVLGSVDLRARLGKKGREEVEQRFTVSRVRREHLKLYRDALGTPAG